MNTDHTIPVLRGRASAIGDDVPNEFMFMAGGRHTLHMYCGDRAKPTTKTVDVLVEPQAAAALQQQLQAVRAKSGQEPYCDFNHENREASFWPKEFFWEDSPAPGVYVRGLWSDAGRDAVRGRMFRSFSPEFYVDNVRGNPARIKCYEGATLNFGGLVNDPAFKRNLPLRAKHAGNPSAANSNQQNTNQMTKEKLAELEGHKQQKLQELEVLRAKGTGDEADVQALRAAESEMEKLDLQIQNGELLIQQAENNASLMARRITDADSEVAVAIKRGAIALKDTALQERWKKNLIADPTQAEVLRAMKGFVALTPGGAPQPQRISGYNHGIVREANEHVLRAMSACQMRQTPDVEYADKLKLARELTALYAKEILPRLKEGDDIPLRGSNSLGTLATTVASIRTLELLALGYSYPILKRITTDYSDQIVSYGDTLKTRYITIPSVQTYNTTTGWPTDSDHVTTDVAMTYDQFKAVPISIGAHHIAGTIRRLFDEVAPAQAEALGKDIVDYMYALITSAFSGQTDLNGATVGAVAAGLATFGRSTCIDLSGALDDMGNPTMGRTLLLNRLYYSALKKDQTIITLAAFQKPEIIEKGVLPDVEDFDVVKAINLPATAIGGKVLKGFGFTRSALVLATRLSADYVNVLPGAGNGNLQVVTTPGGFSANQVQYVDHKTAQARQRLEVIYAGSRGQLNAGEVLTDV